MQIGVPKEIKVHEYRVGLSPASVLELTRAGHSVLVEYGAGEGIGFTDQQYKAAGALLGSVDDAFAAELVVKVKEPFLATIHRFGDFVEVYTSPASRKNSNSKIYF